MNGPTRALPLEKISRYSMLEERAVRNENIHALVERIKEGDREAFMTVTSRYQKKVFLLAFSFFRNREDALDIVQETFLRFYQKAHLFQRGKNFQSWLLQMAKNLCIDHYRKHQSRTSRYEDSGNIENVSHPRDDEGAFKSVDLKLIFSRSLKKLTDKQRMIFVMKQYNQLKYTEIAQILDISVGTVKSLHFKAVQNLRVAVTPYLGR